MIRLIAAGLGMALLAAPALACPDPTDELIFHSCWGEARAELLLLPEDGMPPEPPETGVRLIVTGAYTSRETRGEDDLPAPVGFYMRDGELVNRNMSRMDGLLVVQPDGARIELHNRAEVAFGGRTYNLRQPDARSHFADAAAAAGLDVLQSHLLIIEGRIDVRDDDEAPQFRRRVLFTGKDGFGIYETPDAVTLYEAATRLEEAHAPEMAMNLDMGSYDFCLITRDGVERRCGVLGREQAGKLSNLLMLTLR